MWLAVSYLLSAFSVYAGTQVGKAFLTEKNRRKGLVLTGMWVVMYSVFAVGYLTSL